MIQVWWEEDIKVVPTQKILSMLLYLPDCTYIHIKKKDKYFFASFYDSLMQQRPQPCEEICLKIEP